MEPGRRALISLAVIGVAASAALFAVRLRPPLPPPPAESNRPVFDFAPAAVKSIDIQSWQGTLRAERTGGSWRVSDVLVRRPGGTEASERPSEAEIDGVVSGLVKEVVELPQIDRFPREDRPLADFGLAKPQAVVTLGLVSGEERRLEIGDLTIASTAVYARAAPPDDVIEIGSAFFNAIDGALYRLRALSDAPPPDSTD